MTWFLSVVISLAYIFISAAATAQNPVLTIDDEFLNDTRLTSGLLVAGPPEVAREMAIFGGAMFDAANAASGLSYAPVAYSGGAVPGVSVDAATLAAGYTSLQAIFANAIWADSKGGSASLQTAVVDEINATYTSALNGFGITDLGSQCASPAGGLIAVCGGISLGTTAANANLAANGYTVGNNAALATDGSSKAILDGFNHPYTPPNNNAGTYVPTSSRPAMFPEWNILPPTGMTSSQMATVVAAVPGPKPLTSVAYQMNVLQTECQGGGTILPDKIQTACAAAGFSPETTEQAKAALFWNDPGTTVQPPGHWLDIMDHLATSQSLSTLQTARLTSLVGQAENDAGIGAWTVKYQDLLWRPVTAINDCSNWNPNFTTCDPGWTSLIATPPHPDYVAGHPAFSGAAATVMEKFFGTNNIPITSVSDAYCNGGAPLRGTTTGPIIACVVTPTSTTGLELLFNNLPTIYAPPSACAALGGVLAVDVGNNPVSCTIGSTEFFFNPTEWAAGTGCNDIVNGGANDSLLICPITENFPTISDASQGPDGAEFSRVVGGIHTPDAVVDALTLGNQIGQVVANDNNIPEPGVLGLLALPLGFLAGLRRHGLTRTASAT